MMVEGETLWIKLFSGYTWYTFHNKTQKNIYFAQLRHHQENIQNCETYTKYIPFYGLLSYLERLSNQYIQHQRMIK